MSIHRASLRGALRCGKGPDAEEDRGERSLWQYGEDPSCCRRNAERYPMRTRALRRALDAVLNGYGAEGALRGGLAAPFLFRNSVQYFEHGREDAPLRCRKENQNEKMYF